MKLFFYLTQKNYLYFLHKIFAYKKILFLSLRTHYHEHTQPCRHNRPWRKTIYAVRDASLQ